MRIENGKGTKKQKQKNKSLDPEGANLCMTHIHPRPRRRDEIALDPNGCCSQHQDGNKDGGSKPGGGLVISLFQ
jgi:hypothetical protein